MGLFRKFLALAVSLEDLGNKTTNQKAKILSETLNTANEKFLDEDKSPSRKAGELDNRGSHFFLSLYWAEALANQDEDTELKATFSSLFSALDNQKDAIIEELNGAQCSPVDIGGYYLPETQKASAAMRPSELFNKALSQVGNIEVSL